MNIFIVTLVDSLWGLKEVPVNECFLYEFDFTA